MVIKKKEGICYMIYYSLMFSFATVVGLSYIHLAGIQTVLGCIIRALVYGYYLLVAIILTVYLKKDYTIHVLRKIKSVMCWLGNIISICMMICALLMISNASLAEKSICAMLGCILLGIATFYAKGLVVKLYEKEFEYDLAKFRQQIIQKEQMHNLISDEDVANAMNVLTQYSYFYKAKATDAKDCERRKRELIELSKEIKNNC